MRWTGVLLREATASARSQAVASVLTLLMVAGMVLTVMLTTGRTVAAEQQVLHSIDTVGTRTITIRAEDEAGVRSAVLDRTAHIGGIEWSAAFSSAVDAANARIYDGAKVAVRQAYGEQLSALGVPSHTVLPGELAYASPLALERLGMPDDAGAIVVPGGETVGVGGALDTPDFLRGFEPLVIIPRPDATGDELVNVVVVVASSPEMVKPVSDAVLAVLEADDPSRVTLQTSEQLANLRVLIESQLGSFSRSLVLGLLALTGALVAVILYGLVMMRRKDFGRRRALGATRSFIVMLLLAQTAIVALGGIAVGVVAATVTLATLGNPQPGIEFTAAVAILALGTALVAALAPALVASRREPIRELRVP